MREGRPPSCSAKMALLDGQLGDLPLVRLRVRTNSGVEVPVGQSTGCP